MHSSGSESVAISPPPDGASVAEAKPIGLAIAGTLKNVTSANSNPKP